jgi:hypothetical protein
MSTPVAVGCLPGEVVIRGGMLSKPVILPNAKMVGDTPYIYLWKTHPVLCKFFSGKASCKRPLAGTLVFERLQKARNTKFQELVQQLRDVPVNGVLTNGGDGGDLAEQLDLEAPTAKVSPSKARRLVSVARLMPQLPATALVSYDNVEGWQPRLLMESSTKAPAIEASHENLQKLFELVEADLELGTVHSPRHALFKHIASEIARARAGLGEVREVCGDTGKRL